ncbi:sulfite oxidase [Tautonia sociabilis]|uniref:Sulfite oxidase-like oxidoreductase n=1 Tax=Tautonia sociabilis TaxID=2080755 RepID=A0A432MNL6_9BACT|nr:sulfite oxidase [Tautonia sociabilis]RUL88777.1 sulfite oxidase-like oxidoreductase [Tautonia sociabilis]
MSRDANPPAPAPSRREALRRGLGGAAGLGIWAWSGASPASWAEDARAEGQELIIHNLVPLDAETPVTALGDWITPIDRFFVRSHFGAPAIGPDGWRLSISGLVDRPIVLSLDDLAGMDQVAMPAVLQCAGNGRGLFKPNVPGIAWARGAVGNAEWSGVRLRDVLDRAGVRDASRHVHLLGADLPPHPKTPAFLRSIPLEKAMDPTTILATHMNGQPLPDLHGGPIRVVVPCWTANHSVKWLRELTLAEEEAPGFYQQTGYRIPRTLAPPGSVIEDPTADVVPVTAMNVKSLITHPGQGQALRPGRVEIAGVAWTGPGRVTRVEVSVDDGPWQEAALEGPEVEGSWRTWRLAWEAPSGPHTLRARATDSHGETQPEQSPWNKSGYLWNAIERVSVEVG